MLATHGDSRRWLWLTLFVTAAIVLVVQVPLLLESLYVDEDLRFFYWLYRIGDPALFQSDPLLGYQIGELNVGRITVPYNKVALLYGTLYLVVSRFITPYAFSKLLMLPLALIASYYLFRLGQRLAGAFTACLLSALFTLIVVIPYSDITYASGLPRAFTLPLLLAMLYYMTVGSTLGMAVVLVLGMFYPPAFLTILLTYGVKYGLESVRRRSLALTGRQFTMLLAALLLSILLLTPALLTGLNQVPVDSQGQQGSTVFSSPLYGQDGRYPLLNSTFNANGGLFDFGPIGYYSMLLLLCLIPIGLVLGRRFRSLPAPYWYLVLGSLTGFVLSWLVILLTPSASLHMPSRYTQGTVFIVSLTLFAINAPLAIQVASRHLANNQGRLDWLLAVVGLALLLLVFLSGAPTALSASTGLLVVIAVGLAFVGRRRSRTAADNGRSPAASGNSGANRGRGATRVQTVLAFLLLALPLLVFLQLPNRLHRPGSESAELVSFAKTLPQDTLISGYPCLVDDIPLYAQRTVLFSCEVESRDMALMLAALDAYFAEDEAEVLGFCRQYGVDYMVASPETFTEAYREQERIMFEPLDSYVRQQLEGRSDFALDQIPETSKIFHNDTLYVFPCTADAFAAGKVVGARPDDEP